MMKFLFSKISLPVISCCLLLFITSSMYATTYYARTNGPWTTTSTWSLSSGGPAIPSGFPGAGDDVIIEGGFTVTIAASAIEHLYAASVVIGGASSSGTLSYPNGNTSSTLEISGDLTVGGTGVSASGTIHYGTWGLTITCARLLKGAGSASRVNPLQQDFTFTGNFTLPVGFNQFRNFIVDGGTVRLSENMETNGSISPLITAGSTLDMSTYAMDIGGYKNFTINGTLVVGGNTGGIGNSNFPSGFETLIIGPASTVVYNYAGDQSIYPGVYHNLVLNGSGTKSTAFIGYVSGLTLTNGGTGYLCGAELIFSGGGGSGASGEADGFGDPGNPLNYTSLNERGTGYTSVPAVTVMGYCGGSGATVVAEIVSLSEATVNGKLTMAGTAVLDGTAIVYGAASSLEYAGSSTQTTGIEFPATWSGSGGIIINNPYGLTLNEGKVIESTITLLNGIITTSQAFPLVISSTQPSAIVGGSETSFINGPLTITLEPGLSAGTTYALPVGKAASYLPMNLVNPVTGAGLITVTAEVFAANSGGTAGAGILSVSPSEYWSLSVSGNFTGSSVSLFRTTALNGINLVGQSNTANGVYNTIGGTVSSNSVINTTDIGTVTNVFFVFASDNTILPVTLMSLAASAQQNGILVEWQVSHEVNMARYDIEKSTDGQHFYSAGNLPAAASGSETHLYTWTDKNPVVNDNYYRIKAVSLDNTIQYSPIVKVVTAGNNRSVSIYPVPLVNNETFISLRNFQKGAYRVILYNQSGLQVFTQSIHHRGGSGVYMFRAGQLLPGVYYLNVEGNGSRTVQRIMKL
jgi:hypothetical protein